MPLPVDIKLPRSASIELVREALARRRMSQKDLARGCGLKREDLARILAGKVPFPRNRALLGAIARTLGMDPAEFPEYRAQLAVLPESTRRLLDHLNATGLPPKDLKARLTRMEPNHLELILRGGAPFPRDPRLIEDLAQAAGTTPFLFLEYLPLDDLRSRLLGACRLALEPADQTTFERLLAEIGAHLDRLDASSFDEAVVRRMVERALGKEPAGEAPADGMLAFIPRWEDLQEDVRRVLEAMSVRGWSVQDLARCSGVDADELFAYAKGQMRLKDPAIGARLMRALDMEVMDGHDPDRG